MATIELGRTAKDKITGFKGIVTGMCQYISGCNQALLVPKASKDGSYKDGQWFDIQRLEVDTKTSKLVLNNGTSPGFDKAPPRRA